MALKQAGGKKGSLDDVPYCVVSTLSERIASWAIASLKAACP